MTIETDSGSPLDMAAHELATRHRIVRTAPDPVPLWENVALVRGWLDDVRLACVDPPPHAGKAAEWLLDNDYQIHRALRQIDKDLPGSFYNQLPALAELEDFAPRVFALAHEYLRAGHLQVSLAGAVRFVRAYQQTSPLTIAELWAFPTMLRIACVEILAASLTPLFEGVLALPFAVSDIARDPQSLDPTERVARAISNLGIIAAIPWEVFFDRTSLVELALSDDPSGHYAQMDFETRDRYRGTVEEMARAGQLDEASVVAAALHRSNAARADEVRRHVGYWLIDEGRPELERELGVKRGIGRRAGRLVLAYPGRVYAAAILVATLGSLILPALYLVLVGASEAGWLGAMAVSLIPASVLAMALVHWAITRSVPPRVLPKLDCRKGLPTDARTFVVVPVVIGSSAEIGNLAQQLETHWLANVDPCLQVALLADFADAPHAAMPTDEQLEESLIAAIRTLNQRHANGGHEPFHLLLRPRLYNSGEGCWMAWERKRGKLEQFNRGLVDGDWAAFSIHEGERAALRKVRYVVTVDADTLLPPGSVARLVGTLAHPLNRARFNRETGQVARGYALVQPRVEISPQAGIRSAFARLFTGDTAIDIYSRAVSDVYQDLFGAGIFVGKGIYDVRAFHASVDGRVPENAILSHDLFEGAHGRAALATDIVLYENFPASYPEYSRRLHRWIRGDWQLLAWLWPRVPGAGGTRLRNPIAGIDRWKILDNLRRSLVAPALVVLALAGWFVLPGSPWFWTALVAFAPGWQLFTDLVSGLARGRRVGVSYGYLARWSDQAGRWLLAMVFLLHEALLSLNAIAVTVWRMFVSRKHLLEWTAAAHVAAQIGRQSARRAVWREMWLGPVIAGAVAIGLLLLRPTALPAAGLLLAAWIAAPEIALWSGRPRRPHEAPLAEGDAEYLRLLARRTWFFFETFAGPEDNWLPPDNYQGLPHEEIGHRTSPTNIGMLLQSSAAAWDLGYVGRVELAARGRNVFDSLGRLERYRGHFYNWYETRHLRPLEPRYVSTVDSGNLAVSLIAYAETLREAAAQRALEPQRWDGLGDLLDLLKHAAAQLALGADLLPGIAALEDGLRSARAADADAANQMAALTAMRDNILASLEERAAQAVKTEPAGSAEPLRDLFGWLDRLRHHIHEMLRDLRTGDEMAGDMLALADEAVALAWSMDFSWLYDRERSLFFIGHNVSASRIDTHHYDLLASEARLASFFAIAKGDVPIEHWFHLQRPVTRVRGGLSLISWNGSMFEYLMPRLLLRGEPETLLGESERVAVEIQRRYGVRHGLPWGVSESAYSERDPEHRYRYQAFGTPGLGLKRGLAREQVVAPYASALALAVAPGQATANLRRLSGLGAEGRYGMWEALDYTPDRVPVSAQFVPVVAYMAHHQGMVLCAIANVLTQDRMVERFARDPQMRLVSLLLSERVPHEIPPEIERLETLEAPGNVIRSEAIAPWEPAPTPFPQVQVMGNGRVSSWISEAGGGGMRWQGQALTRFQPDATRDADGIWLYLHDEESGDLWSATRQPTAAVAEEYRVVYQPHLVEFHRRDHGIDLRLEVGVGSGDDLEIRRLTLVNESDRPRKLRLTSYAEVVLASPLDDERHPAFSKLFVQGEFLPRIGGLLFTRRPRTPLEAPACMAQFAIGADGPVENLRHEVDRREFIGRCRSLRDPQGAARPLSGSEGLTLDPIAALQCEIALAPGERHVVCIVTAVAASPSAALEIAARHATLPTMDWVFGDSAAETARAIGKAQLDPQDLPAIQSLGSLLIHPHGALRAAPEQIRTNELGQSGLWGLALSGDLPILLLRVGEAEKSLVPLLAGAHKFWRRQGLPVDLVLIQTNGSTYAEPMRGELNELLREIGASDMLGRKGGIHMLFGDQIGTVQVRLLESMAWAILNDDGGPVAQQLALADHPPSLPPPIMPSAADMPEASPPIARATDLLFDNGVGGFTPDGREYVIYLEPGEATPSPWANVLANDTFGTLVTETGGGFSWAINSGEYRLTPWTNDPVCDRPVETLYLRDEETAAVWSVTPAPAGQDAPCEIRHGAGYTQWGKHSHGIEQEQRTFTAPDEPIKLVRLRLRNSSGRHRRITATYYAEWLLGSLPSIARRHVACRFDEPAQTICATSSWNADFAGRTAFLTATLHAHSVTSDREEFLGREGDAGQPVGLERWGLAGNEVAGQDACAAYQVHLDLAPDSTAEVTFILGEAASEAEALALAGRWRSADAVEGAATTLTRQWDDFLGTITVETPDPAFDLMINRWLIYQSLSSRIMARAGFYQASGAIGFRDQLQDVLALLAFDPGRARAHILVCAAHQFEEGDVLHWWHPPSDRGVRTRFSDDLLWLPYAVGTYVRATGDMTILDELVPFLSAPVLTDEEHDRYAQFEPSLPGAPLIEHLERALERQICGRNGLPLMGTGDWNDGMDRVGDEGRGESVWLAWFTAVTTDLLADLEHRLGREREADHWRDRAAALRANAEEAGWDGGWYRRAYDDANHPLGANTEEECRIDSISQSWAAFAGADRTRVAEALAAARRELVDEEAALARLLWPPFDTGPRDPGYIKAYPPGLRENGGQYSHAAAWLGLALAQTGDGDAARDIFHMICPPQRTASRDGADHYRIEPYAVAGDIAAAEPHRGKGGWSWYTGAAAWTWRLGVEGLLGLTMREGDLHIAPSLPRDWPGYRATIRRGGATIVLVVDRAQKGDQHALVVDGVRQDGGVVAFPNDGATRHVLVHVAP